MRRLIFALLFAPAVANAYHSALTSTGDLDGDGDIDLIRSGIDATVHTMDVHGGDRRSFATMAPAMPGDSRSGAGPVGSLRDMNSNGSRELVLMGTVAYRAPDKDYYIVEEYYMEIWDPRSHALLYRLPLESGDSIFIVRDLNGDNYRDLVRFDRFSGDIKETLDPITGLQISGPIPTRWDNFNAIVSGPQGLGVLADRANDLSDLIEYRDPDTTRITQRIWIGGGHDALDALSISDLNGNWSTELAVLRRSLDRTSTSVLVLDSRTKSWIRQVPFARWAQPRKLMFVNGTDVAVFSEYTGGAKPLEVRNAKTGQLVTRTWFPKGLRYSPGSVTRVNDINGNGSHEVAFIADVGDDRVTIIRDTRTGEWLGRLTW